MYNNHRIRTFKLGKVFFLSYQLGAFWFRFFGGYGIAAKSLKYKWLITFSERNGFIKTKDLLGWKWQILKPIKLKGRSQND